MFQLDPAKVDETKLVGKGIFGSVYAYKDDQKWVVKKKTVMNGKLLDAMKEVVLGFSCDHPNVLPVKGYHMKLNKESNKWEILIKLPRMNVLTESFNWHVKNGVYFSQEEIIKVSYELALGVE